MMNNKKLTKPKPRGRPQVSTLKRLTKSVTVKFSKPDYEKLGHRSKNANRTLERASSRRAKPSPLKQSKNSQRINLKSKNYGDCAY